jgi:alkylation response protein AidB-like acyl-CoA dehydrogenase
MTTTTTTTTVAERADLRASIRDFLADRLPESTVRELMDTDTGFDAPGWTQLSVDLGLAGLLVPEEHGGQGLSTVELGIALQEAGRALLGAPFLGSAVLATWALVVSGDGATAKRLLPGLADGSTVAALGIDDDPQAPVRAVPDGDGWRLTGAKRHVVDVAAASTLLVTAEVDGGAGLFVVSVVGDGVTVEETGSLDLTRRLGVIRVDGVPAQRVGTDFAAGLESVRELGAFACAAEQAGVAGRCLEIAVEYARTREQFGKPIGSFQAIKHQLAEHLARVEQMRAAVTAAGAELATSPANSREIVSVVKAFCGEAGTTVAEGLIDTLGGIGFTWEHVAHLYLRRMKTLAYLFGSPAEHRARLAADFGLTG